MLNTPQRLSWWPAFWPAVLCLAGITGLSVMPSVQLPKFDLLAPDKLGHALAYGVLGWLSLRGLRLYQGRLTTLAAALMSAAAAGYGVLMEFVQAAFIPGRFFELDDMLANAIGALAAWGIYALAGIYWKRKQDQ
ncbi:MAG: VanZ family protein [Saprospiraceae bacterium]|nr:VanZ family protein [Saprospiraceae bacterium]